MAACACRSPVNPYTNVFPLVIVLAVSLLKEALEDHKRHTKDVEVQSHKLTDHLYVHKANDGCVGHTCCCHPTQHVACPPEADHEYMACALQINNSVAHIVQNGALVPLAWQYVKVGDIVKVLTHSSAGASRRLPHVHSTKRNFAECMQCSKLLFAECRWRTAMCFRRTWCC